MTSSVWNNLKSKLLTDFRTILNAPCGALWAAACNSCRHHVSTLAPRYSFCRLCNFFLNLVWCVAAGLSVRLRWPRFSFLLSTRACRQSSDCWGFSVLQHKTVWGGCCCDLVPQKFNWPELESSCMLMIQYRSSETRRLYSRRWKH